MPSAHHQSHSIQEWLNNINESTSGPVPVPRSLNPEPALYQRDPHHVSENRTRVGLMHGKCDALQTRKLPSWKVQPNRVEPDRLGAQAAFRGNHTFGRGNEKNSRFSQPDAGQKRARARGSSDSSFLEIGLKDNRLPTCGTKEARFSPRGKPERCAEADELSCSDQDVSRPREPQRAFERRPRHRTRKDLYDSKSPRQKKKAASRGEMRQNSTRRIRKKPVVALHRSFAAETISKERLTLKPSSRVGLFKRGRASSPVRKRGLPDLAFSEMQFLHDRKGGANSKPQERLDERKRCGKDELYEKISSYFNAAQRTLGEGDLSWGPPSSQSPQKRTATSEDQGDWVTHKTPSDTLLTHLTSERASRSPLGHVSSSKCASAPYEQPPVPTIGTNNEAASEATDNFTWSVSARSAAPLDESTNENWPRITGSPCHPFPKATIDTEQVNHGSPMDLTAHFQCLRHNQDDVLALQEGKQSTRIKDHSGIDYQEARMDLKNALDKEASTEEIEQPISAIEVQLKSKIPACLGSCINRGASNGQHALDPDSHSIMKSKTQPRPLTATILRDCEIIPRILSPGDSAEVPQTAAEIVASASAPVGTDPDIQRAGLVARPKYRPSDTALDEIPSLSPLLSWTGGHQRDDISRGVTGFRRGKEIARRSRPPSRYVYYPDANRWILPSNGWGNQEEANWNPFCVSPAKQHRPQTQFNADRSIAQTDAQGGSVLTTYSEDLKEILRPQSPVALGPADVDTVEFGHYQQIRNQDTISKGLCIPSPDRIPNNIVSVSSEEESPDDSRVDWDRLETYGSIYENRRSLQPGYSNTEEPFVGNGFHGIYETNWNRGQSLHDDCAVRRKSGLQNWSDNVNDMSMATFWRPHRLY